MISTHKKLRTYLGLSTHKQSHQEKVNKLFSKTICSTIGFSKTDFLQDRLCHDRSRKLGLEKPSFSSKIGFPKTDSFQHRFSQTVSQKSVFPNPIFVQHRFFPNRFFQKNQPTSTKHLPTICQNRPTSASNQTEICQNQQKSATKQSKLAKTQPK